jgi:hypothetical protein
MPTLAQFRKLSIANKVEALRAKGLMVDETAPAKQLEEQARLSGLFSSPAKQTTLTSWLGSKRKLDQPPEAGTAKRSRKPPASKDKAVALIRKCKTAEPGASVRPTATPNVYQVAWNGQERTLMFENAPGSSLGEAIGEMVDGTPHKLSVDCVEFCLGARLPARAVEALEAYSF